MANSQASKKVESKTSSVYKQRSIKSRADLGKMYENQVLSYADDESFTHYDFPMQVENVTPEPRLIEYKRGAFGSEDNSALSFTYTETSLPDSYTLSQTSFPIHKNVHATNPS